MRNKKLKVKEIFRSIQGEGALMGQAMTFIRLSGCNLQCWFCDTDWDEGEEMTLPQIMNRINPPGWICWTGGEPTLQLTDEIIQYFKFFGWKQAIETNGTVRPPAGLDHVACSVKCNVKTLQTTFAGLKIHEYRIPLKRGMEPPEIHMMPPADHYFISPIFTGEPKQKLELDLDALQYCLDYVLKNPEWRLSVQQHKILGLRIR